jgi:hypothetical protein
MRSNRYTGYIGEKQASLGHYPGLTLLFGHIWTLPLYYVIFAVNDSP